MSHSSDPFGIVINLLQEGLGPWSPEVCEKTFLSVFLVGAWSSSLCLAVKKLSHEQRMSCPVAHCAFLCSGGSCKALRVCVRSHSAQQVV